MTANLTGDTPAEAAELAAEALRTLCRLTVGATGYTNPSDVYDVAGHLMQTTHRMADAIESACRWLEGQRKAGRVGVDATGNAYDVIEAISSLQHSASLARTLARNLDDVVQAASHLTGEDPS